MGDPGRTRPRRGDHYPLARRLVGRLHPLIFMKARNPSNPALREAIVIPYHMRGAGGVIKPPLRRCEPSGNETACYSIHLRYVTLFQLISHTCSLLVEHISIYYS